MQTLNGIGFRHLWIHAKQGAKTMAKKFKAGDYVFYKTAELGRLPCKVLRAARVYCWLEWHPDEPIVKARHTSCEFQKEDA